MLLQLLASQFDWAYFACSCQCQHIHQYQIPYTVTFTGTDQYTGKNLSYVGGMHMLMSAMFYV